jgi:hypothetical protein
MKLRFVELALALLAVASSAHAQWTRVEDVPITNIYSVWANGDTITATADSVVYVSTDGGASFKNSVPVAAGLTSVQAARMRNGRLYAGTFGQGVFVSDNLGDSWVAFNQGLTGGFLNTQLFIGDLALDGGKLYAATSGDGPWMRNLATNANWAHFSNIFEFNQSSNMNGIAVGGTRLLASAGFNGTVFFRDAGDPEWTLSWLDNIGIAPGLAALTAIWTGSQWVVGANSGIFYSAQGQSPWTFVDMGFGTLLTTALATRGSDLFGAFGDGSTAVIEYSLDHGVTWHVLDTLPVTFVFGLATHGDTLYAARFDGLWTRSISTVAAQPTTWGSVKNLYRARK